MKISHSIATLVEISEVPGLDPIRVMLTDLGPRRGRINIECYGKSWAAYWGAMGERTIAQFFCSCDEHYLAGNLSHIRPDVFDPDALKDNLKRELLAERRKCLVNHEEARERFNTIEELDLPENANDLWHMRSIEELLGPEWWHSLPSKPNPDYTYLCRIIKTVQTALKEPTL